ncbi:hypothetical protein HK096_000721 [Nowakowskiella sp. JEL0078]|nr:hypothetical protein HK096_000721 [Nowakowskiella sp. JEL0078]
MKKLNDERILDLKMEISIIQSEKTILVQEKKQITEKIKNIRADFYDREEKFKRIQSESNTFSQNSKIKLNYLKKSLDSLRIYHENLMQEHHTLTQKYSILTETREKQSITQKNLSEIDSELKKREIDTDRILKSSIQENKYLIQLRETTRLQSEDNHRHVASLFDKINDLKNRIARNNLDIETQKIEKANKISKIDADIVCIRQEVLHLGQLCDQQELLIENINKQIAEAEGELQAEIRLRINLQEILQNLTSVQVRESDEIKRIENFGVTCDVQPNGQMKLWCFEIQRREFFMGNFASKTKDISKALRSFIDLTQNEQPKMTWN